MSVCLSEMKKEGWKTDRDKLHNWETLGVQPMSVSLLES